MQKRQNCVSIIIRQQKCNEKYDTVDIATTIVVKRSFSKHLCLVEVNLKKSCIFPQSIFKKMPPGTPRNRIRDFSWATLLVVKGCPKLHELHDPLSCHHHQKPTGSTWCVHWRSSSGGTPRPPRTRRRRRRRFRPSRSCALHSTRASRRVSSSWRRRRRCRVAHGTRAWMHGCMHACMHAASRELT